MWSFSIRDALTKRAAKVTSTGQLVVGPVAYDLVEFNTLDVNDAVSNFYSPKAGQQFVITGIIAFADKDISDASDTVIVVYEAGSAEATTVDKILLQFGMPKLSLFSGLPLNLLVNAGKFINAKSGDTDIHMTIMGYYIPAL